MKQKIKNEAEKILIRHNSGFLQRNLGNCYLSGRLSLEDNTRKPARCRCRTLKIKINYIYLRQSPLKKFPFCTIFLLRNAPDFGRWQVMWALEKWSIEESEVGIWNWHAKEVLWCRICADRHYICQAQLKIFLRAFFCCWARNCCWTKVDAELRWDCEKQLHLMNH